MVDSMNKPLSDLLRDTVTDPIADTAERAIPMVPVDEIEGVSPMKCPSPEVFRLRREMPTHIVDDIVGVSPMVAPTMPIAELRRRYEGGE